MVWHLPLFLYATVHILNDRSALVKYLLNGWSLILLWKTSFTPYGNLLNWYLSTGLLNVANLILSSSSGICQCPLLPSNFVYSFSKTSSGSIFCRPSKRFVYMFMIIWCSSFPNFPVTILTFFSISAFSIDVATGSSCWRSCDITLLIKVNSRLKVCSSSRCCHQWFFSKNLIKCSENLLWTWWLLKSEVCFIDFL